MSKVRVKVFPAKDNHGQIQLDINGFLAGEDVSYVGHTVSAVSLPSNTPPASYDSVSKRFRQYKTHYSGSIAYQNKVS